MIISAEVLKNQIKARIFLLLQEYRGFFKSETDFQVFRAQLIKEISR